MARSHFRRLVIGLHRRPPEQALQVAVDLAGLLGLDLFGLFIENSDLLGLAALPFAREIGSLGGDWRPLEADRLLYDLRLEASSIERRFARAVKRLNRAWRFEIVRGCAADTFGTITGIGDIVMLIEPANPAERATAQFLTMAQAAFRSTAAVLLVPPRLARRTGPVVAVATREDDPSIEAAALIAAAAREDLVILATDDARDASHPAARRVLRADVRVLADPAAMAGAFGPEAERLVVVTRQRLTEHIASAVAVARGVPVLVIAEAT